MPVTTQVWFYGLSISASLVSGVPPLCHVTTHRCLVFNCVEVCVAQTLPECSTPVSYWWMFRLSFSYHFFPPSILTHPALFDYLIPSPPGCRRGYQLAYGHHNWRWLLIQEGMACWACGSGLGETVKCCLLSTPLLWTASSNWERESSTDPEMAELTKERPVSLVTC